MCGQLHAPQLYLQRKKKHLAATKQDGRDPGPVRRFLRKQKSMPLLAIEP